MSSNSTPLLRRLALGCTLAFFVTGCAENLARTDKISLDAGDAVARNKVAQMIDPWPHHAERTRIETDANRVGHAIDVYQDPSKEEDKGPQKTLLPIVIK